MKRAERRAERQARIERDFVGYEGAALGVALGAGITATYGVWWALGYALVTMMIGWARALWQLWRLRQKGPG